MSSSAASVLYDAQEYLVAGPENQAEWWEHLGDAHRDYAALAQAAIELRDAAAAVVAFHAPDIKCDEEACSRPMVALRKVLRGKHLSSAKAAPVTDPEAYGRDHRFVVHSPHGDWNVVVSMYAIDSLPASTLAGHAKNHLVPISQFRYVWYLTEDGRRLPDDELVRCDRPREFNLCMELS